MLDIIKGLEKDGQWTEIRQLSECIIAAGLESDQRARALLSLSKAWEETASCAADYRRAAGYAVQAVHVAAFGSLMHTWSLARAAAMLADCGEFDRSRQAAESFFAALPNAPGAAAMEPWAAYALGRAYSRLGRQDAAMSAFERARRCARGELLDRIHITIARALARAGRISEAIKALPNASEALTGHCHAAKALIMSRAGQWQLAESEARAALETVGAWRIHDVVEVAELLLTLKVAAHRMGRHGQAAAWHFIAAAVLSRLAPGIMTTLMPTLRQEGGGWFDAATPRCGAPGCKRVGLRGAVG